MFWFVPTDRAKYLLEESPFGEKVKDKFPKLQEDISESVRCLGFGRWTATVFHLMRVMEAGVQHLIKLLGLSATVSVEQPWGALLSPIDNAIKTLPGGTSATTKEKARKASFSEAAAFLRHVKDAWRNDTMHPKRTYTEEEAKAVFDAVKAFMQSLVKLPRR